MFTEIVFNLPDIGYDSHHYGGRSIERNKGLSVVSSTALDILDKASEAQRNFMRSMEEAGGPGYQPRFRDLMHVLSRPRKKVFYETWAACTVTSMIPEFEQSIVNGKFSNKTLVDTYNRAAEGTFLLQWDYPEALEEEYTDETHERLFEQVRRDPTFSSLFTDEAVNSLLPGFVRRKLVNTGVLPIVQTETIPLWGEIVRSRAENKKRI